jgi:membrane protease YdiL (CAAX protease family)
MTTTNIQIILGVFASIAILFPLLILFWWWGKFPKAEIGFRWGLAPGIGKQYAMAALYPLAVMLPLIAVAALTGSIDTSQTNWNSVMTNVFAGIVGTTIAVIITEEGFFRGWLWAALKRAGYSLPGTIIVSSLVFSAWHISAVSLETDLGFDLPWNQIPIYLVNATLLGVVFGLLRQLSGSIIVCSVSHGVWNGLAYALFGFGEKTGALGIEKTWLFGPEVGLFGIVLNGLFALWLWRVLDRQSR